MTYRMPFRLLVAMVFLAGVAPAAPLSILSSTLPPATVGTAYTQGLTATGGTLPYSWTLESTLPAGLSFASDGVISGTATTPGLAPFTFGVTLTDAAGNSAFATLSLAINPKKLAITTASPLAGGIAGVEYPHKILAATGGFSPYTFAIMGGSLPSGMTLTNGTIEGTPVFPGNYQITVTVTDSSGATAFAPLAMAIKGSTTDLLISEGSVAFSLSQGAGAPPATQVLEVQSSVVSTQLS